MHEVMRGEPIELTPSQRYLLGICQTDRSPADVSFSSDIPPMIIAARFRRHVDMAFSDDPPFDV